MLGLCDTYRRGVLSKVFGPAGTGIELSVLGNDMSVYDDHRELSRLYASEGLDALETARQNSTNHIVIKTLG